MKKNILIYIVMTAMLVVLTSVPVMATETVDSSESTQLFEIPELDLGETKVINSNENGTMFVTLVSEDNTLKARGTERSSQRSYMFQYQNLLGIKKDAFRVDLTCHWNDFGVNSYMRLLQQSTTIYANSFTCNWTNSYQTPGYSYLDLTAKNTSSGDTAKYRFSASVIPNTNPSIQFAY